MNIQQILGEMQKAQKQYEKAHAAIEQKDYEYTANGAVKIVLKGSFEIVSIEILDKDLLSKDDEEMLTEMIKLAYNGAKELISADEEKLAASLQQGAGLGKLF